MSDKNITNGSDKPTQARIKFFDERGLMITMITCGTEQIDHVVKGVSDQMWMLTKRQVKNYEVERF